MYREINNQVSKTTNGMIDNIIDHSIIDQMMTQFLIVNAIYFKAKFMHKFDPDDTHQSPFYEDHTRTKLVDQVDMMFRSGTYKYGWFKGNHIVRLPYANTHVELVLIKRDAYYFGNISIPDPGDFSDINWYFERADLWLPKFRIDFDANFVDDLGLIGVPT